jgi:large subunit ribosomal protein L10
MAIRTSAKKNEPAPTEDAYRDPALVLRWSTKAPSGRMERFFSLESDTTSMPTAKKEAAVQELRDRLAGSKNLFLTDFQGLTVEDITKLRGELRKDGNTYSVVKNTLFRRAAGDKLASELDAFLAGPTGIVFASGNDPVAPAKALKQFTDERKKLSIKAAYIDGQLVDATQVAVLASLPPKIELLAKLVGTLSNPMRGLVTVLSGNSSGLVRVLNKVREQKEAAGTNA